MIDAILTVLLIILAILFVASVIALIVLAEIEKEKDRQRGEVKKDIDFGGYTIGELRRITKDLNRLDRERARAAARRRRYIYDN